MPNSSRLTRLCIYTGRQILVWAPYWVLIILFCQLLERGVKVEHDRNLALAYVVGLWFHGFLVGRKEKR